MFGKITVYLQFSFKLSITSNLLRKCPHVHFGLRSCTMNSRGPAIFGFITLVADQHVSGNSQTVMAGSKQIHFRRGQQLQPAHLLLQVSCNKIWGHSDTHPTLKRIPIIQHEVPHWVSHSQSLFLISSRISISAWEILTRLFKQDFFLLPGSSINISICNTFPFKWNINETLTFTQQGSPGRGRAERKKAKQLQEERNWHLGISGSIKNLQQTKTGHLNLQKVTFGGKYIQSLKRNEKVNFYL